MNQSPAKQDSAIRSGPRSMTPADLIALVLGCALAFSLPWVHRLPSTIIYQRINMPEWIQVAFVLGEGARKVALAIIPVIVARRFRHGGLPRPTEWLAVFAGASLIPDWVEGNQWILRFGRWCFTDLRSTFGFDVPVGPRTDGVQLGYGSPTDGDWGLPRDYMPFDEYRIWAGLMLAIALVSVIVVGVFRSRLPQALKLGLLVIAASASVGVIGQWRLYPTSYWFEDCPAWWGFWSPPGPPIHVPVKLFGLLGSFPVEVLLSVPGIAALGELRRRETRDWAWTDWVAVAIAMVCFVQTELPEAYAGVMAIPTQLPFGLPSLNIGPLILIVRLLFAVFVGQTISRRFGPRWNRFSSPDLANGAAAS